MNIAATRFHTNGGKTQPDIEILKVWCSQALAYADQLLVATDHYLFESVERGLFEFCQAVKVLLVNPWQGFTTPLNALLDEATRLGGRSILIQSVEVQSRPSHIRLLHEYLHEDTLVVGAKLTKEHGQSTGIQKIDALNSPWNTLALWDLQKLNITGFSGLSNGVLDGIPGGMEEVVTISALQHLYPDMTKSKLIQLPHLSWDIIWNDQARLDYHQTKMNSKLKRAEIQLQHCQHPRGNVEVM